MADPDGNVCRPVELPGGEVVRVRGRGEMSDEARVALGEVVAAARQLAAETPRTPRQLAMDAIHQVAVDKQLRISVYIPRIADAVLAALRDGGHLNEPEAADG